ncbi:MAG: hypothetical protein J6B54_02015 [Clostridia bacterium]|nr:hypothetical protein [Clostridia bacterium]
MNGGSENAAEQIPKNSSISLSFSWNPSMQNTFPKHNEDNQEGGNDFKIIQRGSVAAVVQVSPIIRKIGARISDTTILTV